MCGRYATTRPAADLAAVFESYDETGDRLAADYNVAPTDAVPVVRRDDEPDARRLLSLARWGFVPSWAKDTRGAARMINARAETVATSRAYASAFAKRRCLVPADGWYEWVRRDGVKQPYFMTPRDGEVLAFAGIWSRWRGGGSRGGGDSRGDGGDSLLTCSVVTTAALGELAEVHERMPLLLPPERWSAWLAGGGEPAELLAPAGPEWLARIEIRPVGPEVGDVRNDGPGLIERVPVPAVPESEPVDLTLF
ncbi:SOS response-associated peptidase [Micromonospora sp. NPDC049559]|uniref:SOS response-associated peptidase n=1 Tax=Micromonospora sp. NPDC049559 TaxID=3155923 RepID=UPI0034239986